MSTIRLLIAAALVAVFSYPVSGQQRAACDRRADVLKHLSAKYAEAPVAIGLANNGGVLEVLSSPKGASWTMIITMPNGPTCFVAAGENWEAVPPPPSEPGDKI